MLRRRTHLYEGEKNDVYCYDNNCYNVDLKIEIAFQLIELYKLWSGTQLLIRCVDVLDITLCNNRFYNIYNH